MPDRAIIPLIAAAACGFIGGVIAAVRETYGTTALVLGIILGVVVAATGAASVVRVRGEESERRIVGVLRALLGAASFGFLYAGILKAVRDGSMVGVLLILVAGVFAALLTRLRVREREELHDEEGSPA